METKETIDYAILKLGELGDALTPTAQKGWDILVRQHIIMGIVPWACFLFFGCALYFLQKGLKKQLGSDVSIEDNPAWLILTILFGVGVIGTFMYGVIDGLPQMLNPEYYAIKELLPK